MFWAPYILVQLLDPYFTNSMTSKPQFHYGKNALTTFLQNIGKNQVNYYA